MDPVVNQTLDALDDITARHKNKLAAILEKGIDLSVQSLDNPYEPLPRYFRESVYDELSTIWAEASVISGYLVKPVFQKGMATKSSIERIAEEWAERYGAKNAASIIKTTKSLVVEKVRRGLANGKTREELVRQILNESPEISAGRARIIVDTEAHTVSQYTSQTLAVQSGLLLNKIWNSVNDERTRDFGLSGRVSQFNHRIMNGQTRPISDSFAVPRLGGGYEALMFPGDPNGSAGNIINCRCIQHYKEAT